MLGDTGANVIGAALGLGVVLGTEESTRIAVMLLLLLLNVAAELVSFSDVIDRVPPLRWFDRLGGLHRAPASAAPTSSASAAAAAPVQDDVAEPLRPVPVRRQLRRQPRQAPEVLGRGDDDSADVV